MKTTMNEILLKDVYSDFFPIGVAIGNSKVTARYDDLLPHFNSITCGFQMKWGETEPKQGVFDYKTADLLVQYAKDTGKRIRGHTLVWHQSLPAWVFGDNPTKDVLLDRMRTHIDNVVRHFGKDVYSWDVVNEALKVWVTDNDLKNNSIYRTGQNTVGDWYAIAGVDYIVEAFKQARRSADAVGATDLKLFYNDGYLNLTSKRTAFMWMFNYLKGVGAPIDGVGMEGHYAVPTLNVTEFEESVKQFTEMGLDVEVTELDLSVYALSSDTPYDELPEDLAEKQGVKYGQIFEVLRRYAKPTADGRGRVTGATLWGVADDETWLDRTDPPRKDWPLLFDVSHQPKPGFQKIIDFSNQH